MCFLWGCCHAETVTGDFPRRRWHRRHRTAPPPAPGTGWALGAWWAFGRVGLQAAAAARVLQEGECEVWSVESLRHSDVKAPSLHQQWGHRGHRGHRGQATPAALHPPSRPGSGLWLCLGLVTRTDSPRLRPQPRGSLTPQGWASLFSF